MIDCCRERERQDERVTRTSYVLCYICYEYADIIIYFMINELILLINDS